MEQARTAINPVADLLTLSRSADTVTWFAQCLVPPIQAFPVVGDLLRKH
jgi:hypothetical protein